MLLIVKYGIIHINLINALLFFLFSERVILLINSMTGFGRSSCEANGYGFTVEVKSVNHRFLDLNIKMPRNLMPLEGRIRKLVSEKLNRGKIDLFLTESSYLRQDVQAYFNETLGNSYYNCLQKIKSKYPNIRDDISVSLLARFPDVITVDQQEENLDKLWEIMSDPIEKALDMLAQMRRKEGAQLYEDISGRCSFIKSKVDDIEKRAPFVVVNYREKLNSRLKELLQDNQIDEGRVAMEVALMADKVNIDEEIVRLKSHVKQMENTLIMDEPVGRKLDFLVQEMNREANTISSKANDLELTNIVLNIKNEIEKIREQIQNVE